MNDALARDWLTLPAAAPNEAAGCAAERRQLQLTKPPGSLGQIERLAIRLAALQGNIRARRGPRAHRRLRRRSRRGGRAGLCLSAKRHGSDGTQFRPWRRGDQRAGAGARPTLEVINIGTVNDTGPLAGVIDCRLGPGTANFTRAPAMGPEQCTRAMEVGRQAAERAHSAGAQLFIGGEMGIGNTTAGRRPGLRAARSSARANGRARHWARPHRGSAQGGGHPAALALHQAQLVDPLLITHGGPIRILLCHALGKPLDRLLEIDAAHAALYRLCVGSDTDSNLQTQLLDLAHLRP